jgi:threonine dehydratase
LSARVPEAARRLCRVTPFLDAPALGCALKLESLQRTGSFKLRGAAVKLASLDAAERARGVVAASAGNHGAGVACAARALDLSARVVVPSTAPRVKREAIAALGAALEVHGASYEEAEARARQIAAQSGAVFISPFDDERVIDGNGRWLAEELLAQRPALERVVVPVGGGGLAGGLAEVLAPRGVAIWGAQPATNCAMHDSLVSSRALTTYDGGATRCEGLEGPVAERTFALCRDGGVRVALVDEESILEAVAFAWRELGLVVEPSAAAAIAALRSGKIPAAPSTVAVVTGGNLDPELLDLALAHHPV